MQNDKDTDALKARLVRAFYDLAEQETRFHDGGGQAPDADTRAELARITQQLRNGTGGDGLALIEALETAEAYLLRARGDAPLKTV
jgi:gamma-glutamyltranspeptidase